MTAMSRLTGPVTGRLRGLSRLPLLSRVALGLLLLVVLAAALAPWLAPHDPYAQSGTAGGPSADHWMGQDSLGRDILSRLMHGARWSLAIGLGATGLALLVGAVLGAVAATSRRAVDEALMRTLDVVMAFPGVALAAVLISVFGGGVPVLVCAIAFLYTPPIARVVRANVLAQYSEDYVTAERVLGARTPYILVRHVAVNCAAPILVFCTVMVADAIVFEASLSFVGAGVRPPEPSWGSVIADGKNLVLLGGWWATVFPGLLMLLTVLALNILAEGASDSWAAPRPAVELPTELPGGTAGSAGALPRPRPAADETVPSADDAARVEAVEPPAAREPLPLPGLDQAGARLRALARPPVTGEPVLSVRDLTVRFPDRHRGVEVLSGVSFDVRPGEVLGLVGESGCGKSLTALTVMGLQPRGAEIGGSVRFAGRELTGLRPRARRALLGHQMAMVYQDALSSLNPAMTIRAQLRQLVRRGGRRSPAELLGLVGLDPDRVLRAYPHELSGGQRQRVLIAMALSREPRLIVADEPTTALDVTIQAQVIQLLLRLRAELGFALVLVSHDLALVADVTDRVVVMYGGQIAERGVTADLVGAPAHHYTRGLLGSVLSLESGAARMTQIRGVVPAPADFPAGCRFAGRCPLADAACAEPVPPAAASGHDHVAACHHPAPPPPDAPPVRTESEVSP
ncbi:dipeptide/oligopeptide/nickel ABC transporter permease/ATP-binding protein [Streptomyces sp. DSM 44915]|uniref:Dipeptide/oligopeptide/nickel ABC transporter permease/ATP-binding protein n=1 Tax=Streptomyces chisholmiae TaxID=3075540 RepID=A0ABU2JRX6_9ACTN|nr:dipeptide/oligopeptide/nickel ABC transporter permease/ATP-binding protein [Streptomyces sp. DSM 44915]MDT0267717.1 dipeptide/oligopeptide/nickel ABC transporter permease/ATP-binding protein [Streptomyces sp. DSM 44915]